MMWPGHRVYTHHDICVGRVLESVNGFLLAIVNRDI